MITSAPVNIKEIADLRFIKRSRRERIDRAKLGRIKRKGSKIRVIEIDRHDGNGPVECPSLTREVVWRLKRQKEIEANRRVVERNIRYFESFK